MLGIVIPVYNEGAGIGDVIAKLIEYVKTPHMILICYDFDEDNTIPAVRRFESVANIRLVKNRRRGPHEAVMTGIAEALGEDGIDSVVVFPADDTFNAPIIDRMYREFSEGAEIVCASRFMAGGTMENCPPIKRTLVKLAAFTMYHLARVPTHDPTSGFRFFSRRVLEEIPVESKKGFTYSVELLVKAHRRKWKIVEIPAQWVERRSGKSRFKILEWMPEYLRWYLYSFSTLFLRGLFFSKSSREF